MSTTVEVEVDVEAEQREAETETEKEAQQENGLTPASEDVQQDKGAGQESDSDADEETEEKDKDAEGKQPLEKDPVIEDSAVPEKVKDEEEGIEDGGGEKEKEKEKEGEEGEKNGKVEEAREKSTSPIPGVPTKIGEFLQMMQMGTDFLKVKKSKVYPRTFKLEYDLLGISWNSRTKKGSKARIAIKQIRELRRGRSTDSFKMATHADFSEENCLSVVYLLNGKHCNLDLVAMSRSDVETWMSGLGTLITAQDSGAHRSKVRDRWLRDLFEDADQNGDGTLDLKEVIAMLRKLNVGVSKKVIREKFKEADTEGSDQKLDFEEFCGLYKAMATRPEMTRLFHLYSSKNEWLTTEDLRKFLQLEQGVEDASVEYCSELISQYEATEQGKTEKLMSLDGFTLFLLGPENDLFNKSHRHVYQDMTQPLAHYHIASSHNTYLLEDQLKGPSSVEAYIRALQKGCRCVEMDCWDGEDGEPIIYHGHTLTSKILFKDVVVAIKEHAFAVSPYPVILSIENHCSVPQQTKMAHYFEDILGDMLYTEPVDTEKVCLPSPESLKGKILLKGKKLNPELEGEEEGGEVSDEDEAAEIDSVKLAEVQKDSGAAKEEGEGEGEGEGGGKKEGAEGSEDAAASKTTTEKNTLQSPSASVRSQRSFSFRKKRTPENAVAKPKKKVKLSTRLSKCINYVQSIHFKGFDDWGEGGKFYQMSSFGESSAVKYSSRTHATAFMLYNKKQLSRTYPSGRRVDSSNYNPVEMWNSGCQIVALNYQTQDLPMDLNDGKFLQNGGCGYILKPRLQREEFSHFDVYGKALPALHPKLYTISIISGQMLPKPPGGNKTGEIIDPYIVLNTYGRYEDNNMFKTKTVQDNGFNPVWNQTFSFVVQTPDYTLIRFKVMDEDWGPNADDFIGQFTAPLESILPGYRHIHLMCSGSPLENASIFVHVSIRDYFTGGRGPGKTKKSKDYPSVNLVSYPAIDTVIQSSYQSVCQAVDLQEDFVYRLFSFKESCGHGPQALLSDCIQLMAFMAKASQIPLFLTVEGDTKGSQVYKAGCPSELQLSKALVNMINSFNMLNVAMQTLVTNGDKLADNLEKAYKECCGQRANLKQHLQETGANSRKIHQIMENYGYSTCTLTIQASKLKEYKEQALDELKLIEEAARKCDIELKTTM